VGRQVVLDSELTTTKPFP